jgi:glycosyltransferase involved in cell wall biosynthesis
LRGLVLKCVVITSAPLNRKAELPHHGIRNYVFFTVYGGFRFFYVSLTKRYSTLFLTVPPPTTSIFIILAKALRKRIVVDIQDLWPEILVEVGYIKKGSFLHVALGFLERVVFRNADRIITVSPDLAQKIRFMTPKPIYVVESQADPTEFNEDETTSQLRLHLGLTGRKILLYIGTVGRVQRFESIVLAMPAVLESHPDAMLIVVGSGDQIDSLLALTDTLGIAEHVRFLPPVPHADVPRYMSIADVCLLPLDTTEIEALPTKFFEYLASGRPVLATSSIAVSRILHESGAGVFVEDPRNTDEMARAIVGLLSDGGARQLMGKRAREYARQRYDLPAKLSEALRL